MKKLSQEEFFAKYGDTEMSFHSYFKYVFTYEGTTKDGLRVTAHYGGESSEIYRHGVSAGSKESLESINPYYATVHDENDNIVDEMESVW